MKQLFILFAGAWLFAGCASPNVNPPAARTDAGYVDCYAVPEDGLNWQVACFDPQAQRYRVVFSEFKPLPDGVLRLALPPGRQQLRVTFLNRVIHEPAVCEVEVAARMVTPVHVVLTEDGVTQVQGRDGSTPRNRISIVANGPMPYRVKEQMPYVH